MSTLAGLYLRVHPDLRSFGPEVARGARTGGTQAGKAFAQGARRPLVQLTAFIGAAFTGRAVINFFKSVVAEARESVRVTRQTSAVIRSTGGAAKVSATHVQRLADRLSLLSGIDDEVIQSGANMLLTFTSIRNEVGKGNNIFDRATSTVLDMSVALGQDLKSSSIQLGKALNDPIRGMTALRRVGVQFTESQTKQITSMVKSGHLMEAQKVILAELNKEFGGSAAAQADPAKKAQVAWANFKEELGGRFLPVLDRLLTLGTSKLPILWRFLDLVGKGFSAFGAAFSGEGITTESSNFVGIMERLGVAARGVWDVFTNNVLPALRVTVGWFARHGEVTKSLIVIFGSVILALKIYSVTMGIARAITLAFNASLLANPIGLVVAAIAVLIAGVILAYNRFAVFREIVQGAWTGIRIAAEFAWNNVLRPALIGIAWYSQNVVGPVLIWLWQHVIVPAFKAIRLEVQVAWVIIKAIFVGISWYITNIVAPTVLFLWRNVVAPAWAGIRAVFTVGFNVVSAILKGIVWWLRNWVFPWMIFWWKNVVGPMWGGIKIIFNAGSAVVSAIFRTITAIIRNVVAPAFMFLWRNIVAPVWNGIKTVIVSVFNVLRTTVFNPLITLIKTTIPVAFGRAKDAIGAAWNGVRDVVKAPIRFVIETVYTGGIKKLWDKVAGFLHLAKMPDFPLPRGFAGGGVIPGRDTGRDNVLIKARRGEGIAVPELVGQIGAGRFLAWNAMARRGQKIPGFAVGGIVGDVIGKARGLLGDAASWFLGGLGAAAGPFVDKIIKPLINRIPGGGTPAGELARAIPNKMVDAIMAILKKKDSEAVSSAGGPFGPSSGNLGSHAVAAIAYAVARSMGAPGRVLLALMEAGLVESGMRNLNYGDRDSVGFLQQRPSQGWPSPMNVPIATRSFVSRAMRKLPWSGSAGSLAQAVQISAFPSRYDARAGDAVAILRSLGYVGGFDKGGILSPGTFGFNFSPHAENVSSYDTMLDVIERLDSLIDAVERVAPGVGRELTGVSAQMRRISRSR